MTVFPVASSWAVVIFYDVWKCPSPINNKRKMGNFFTEHIWTFYYAVYITLYHNHFKNYVIFIMNFYKWCGFIIIPLGTLYCVWLSYIDINVVHFLVVFSKYNIHLCLYRIAIRNIVIFTGFIKILTIM